MSHRSWAVDIKIERATERTQEGGSTPRAEMAGTARKDRVAPQLWAADIKIDKATEGIQGTATRGRSSPHGAETATQSGIGTLALAIFGKH